MRSVLLAVLLFFVLVAPELGRMIDFHGFETFDPHGPGLGNLFGQVSPFTALGIWPSGDFRLAPGDGAVPAARLLPRRGLRHRAAHLRPRLVLASPRDGDRRRRCWPRQASTPRPESAAPPTPSAKAIEVAAPLATLVILLPLLHRSGRREGRRFRGTALAGLAAAVFLLAAGGCSLLALANAPVGPTSYSPALTELRPLVASGSTVVLASRELLDDRARHALHRLGAARRAGLHRARRRGWRRLAARRPLRHRREVRRRALRGPAGAPRRRPLRALGANRPGPRPQRLPADRRPPGAPGP